MSQSGKLTPNLDQQTTKILNLTVLQRIDSFIEEILQTAAHVTFYEFNIDSNQWSRKDVEGSLFVVKRNSQPRFQFIVMNRLNTDNLVENLLGDFEFEVQVPYLLYRNANQEVNGIWFYNSRECEEIASLFSRILTAYSKVPPKPQMSSTKSEFEELEAVPTMSVMEGPLEPSSTLSTARDVPEDSPFVNFFNMAINTGNASNSSNTGQTYHTPPNVLLPSHAPIATSSSSIPDLQHQSLQHQSLPVAATSTSSSLQYDPPDMISLTNRVHNLLKPSSFFYPSPSSSPALMMPPISSFPPTTLQPPPGLQRPYSTPILQPFPPPTPPISLTPSYIPTPHHASVISRDKVREALIILAQDNQFIDMFYHALMKVQHS